MFLRVQVNGSFPVLMGVGGGCSTAAPKAADLMLQRIPACCGIYGDEKADRLAKEAGLVGQQDRSPSMMKRLSSKPKQREEVVPAVSQPQEIRQLHTTASPELSNTLFRLWTEHNRLKVHFFLTSGKYSSQRCVPVTMLQWQENTSLGLPSVCWSMARSHILQIEVVCWLFGTEEDSRIPEDHWSRCMREANEEEEEAEYLKKNPSSEPKNLYHILL